jgi:non-specific serine/threonine protein kinase
MTASAPLAATPIHSSGCDHSHGVFSCVERLALIAASQHRFDEVVDLYALADHIRGGDQLPTLSRSARQSASTELTAREWEVARLVSEGLTNPQIGETLIISRGTVAVHVKHILARLGMTSRAQIAAWFAQRTAQR